jgi:hypothetical protein
LRHVKGHNKLIYLEQATQAPKFRGFEYQKVETLYQESRIPDECKRDELKDREQPKESTSLILITE